MSGFRITCLNNQHRQAKSLCEGGGRLNASSAQGLIDYRKANPSKTAAEVCKHFQISHRQLYNAIARNEAVAAAFRWA